jgi:hypothetical protein
MALFRRNDKPAGKAGEWYYCLKHGTAEEGLQCASKNRMGPYPTRADAERALRTAAERNEEWDTDPRWNDDGPRTD